MPEVRTQSSISTGLQIVLLQQIAVDPFLPRILDLRLISERNPSNIMLVLACFMFC